MTNHHCVRGNLPTVQTGDENILRDGFYAESLDEERTIPNLKVEQLIIIKDVTDEIQSAMDEGKNDAEKIEIRDNKIDEIKKLNSEEHPELLLKLLLFTMVENILCTVTKFIAIYD